MKTAFTRKNFIEKPFSLPPEMSYEFKLLGLEEGEIYCIGEVNEEMAEYVQEGLLYIQSKSPPGQPFPPVTVIITSNGGDEFSGLQIHDSLMLYGLRGEVTGVVIGKAFSAASMLILQGCKHRIATENASIMCHNGTFIMSFTRKDFEDPEWQEKIRRDFARSDERVINILRNRTARSPAEIKKLLKREEFLSAREAKEFGLIDNIWCFKISNNKIPAKEKPQAKKKEAKES